MAIYNTPKHNGPFFITGGEFPFKYNDVLEIGTEIIHDGGTFTLKYKAKVTSISAGGGSPGNWQANIKEVHE